MKLIAHLLLVMTFLLSVSVAASAQDVKVTNSSDLTIDSICKITTDGRLEKIVDSLAAGKSLSIKSALLDGELRLLVVSNNLTCQFFTTLLPQTTRIEFMFSPLNQYLQETSEPWLLVENADDLMTPYAGIPLNILMDGMEQGLSQSDFNGLLTPGLSPEQQKRFAVSWSNSSWNLDEAKFVESQLSSITVNSYYTTGWLGELFDSTLQDKHEMRPLLLSCNDNVLAFSPAGLKADSRAVLVGGMEAASLRDSWLAFDDAFSEMAANMDDNGKMEMLFQNQTHTVKAVMDFSRSKMFATIEVNRP